MTLHICPLSNRGLLYLHGADLFPFLQGIITNDIEKIKKQPALYAALLTPQGKYLFDFIVTPWKEGVLLDHAAAQTAELIKKLTLYRLRSKIIFEDLSASLQVIALWGGVITHPNAILDPRHQKLGQRVILPKEEVGAFLQANNMEITFEQNYEAHRIALTIPAALKELIPDKSFPLQNNLEELGAIDYQKGCYVGQEVTARTKHRGVVRRHLYTVRIEGPAPAEDAAITLENQIVGEMRSHVKNMGLAQIEIEAAEKNLPLNCAEAKLFIQ